MSSVQVIAFMGVAGAGKTSLVRGVAASLGDASAIFADAYRSIAIGWPNYQHLGLNQAQMFAKWFDEGCRADDYGSWPLLVEHLRELKAGRAITMPEKMWGSPGCQGVGAAGGEHHIRPARYIVLEDAWALRTELRRLVAMTIFIRLPLDIAFARRFERDLQQGEKLSPIIRQYLDVGRRYCMALERHGSGADVLLEGTTPLDDLVFEATRMVRERFERRH